MIDKHGKKRFNKDVIKLIDLRKNPIERYDSKISGSGLLSNSKPNNNNTHQPVFRTHQPGKKRKYIVF